MTDEESRKQTLAMLNANVESAIKAREKWMDANMHHYARVPVGEAIYDLQTGQRLGVVTEHYRYWAGDAGFDTSMDVHCRYLVGDDGRYKMIDNTSRQPMLRYGRKEDLR